MDIKAVTPLGSTALHLAAQKGHAGVANILLEHGIDIKAVTNEGATALHVAAKYGHLGVVEILLAKANHEFDINAMDNFYNTVLDLAALGGHIEIVNTFLGQSNEYNIDKDIISRALAIAEQEYSKTQSPQYKQICDELDYYELQRATQFNIRINNPREISPCIEPKIAEEIEKNISELDKETLITQAPLNQDLNKDDIIQGL
jgi:hypothetical protein